MPRDRFDNPRMDRTLEHVERWRTNPPTCADASVTEAYATELMSLVRAAIDARADLAAAIASGLQGAAAQAPGGLEDLLARRPGSWEADDIRDLAESNAGSDTVFGPRFADTFSRANAVNIEFGDWLATTLGEIASSEGGTTCVLLSRTRKGSAYRALQHLVYGTIGWPGTGI